MWLDCTINKSVCHPFLCHPSDVQGLLLSQTDIIRTCLTHKRQCIQGLHALVVIEHWAHIWTYPEGETIGALYQSLFLQTGNVVNAAASLIIKYLITGKSARDRWMWMQPKLFHLDEIHFSRIWLSDTRCWGPLSDPHCCCTCQPAAPHFTSWHLCWWAPNKFRQQKSELI